MKSMVLILIVLISMSACSGTESETLDNNDDEIRIAVEASVAAQTALLAPQAEESGTVISEPEVDLSYEQPTALIDETPESINPGLSTRFEFFVQEVTTEPIGNGTKRVTVDLAVKNSSYDWSSFGFLSVPFEESGCFWTALSGLSEQEVFPALLTEEGYEYLAVTNSDLACGYRGMWNMPPGLTVSADLYPTYILPIASIPFDVAETTTPKSLRVQIWESGLIGYSTEKVERDILVDLQSIYTGPYLDNSFAEDLYVGGESFRLGKDAEILFGTIGYSETDYDGEYALVPIEVKNLNPAYSLRFSIIGKLANEYGGVCCRQSESESISVGPGQAASIELIYSNFPNPGKYWFFGRVGYELNSPVPESSENFIAVELESK